MTDPSVPTNPELAALKAEFDRRGKQLDELQSELQSLKQNQPAQQLATPTVGRRGLLAGGGIGALALLGTMGSASGATDPNDGDGDLGTSANPWDTYLNGLALDVADISSATTVADPVVRYDPSVSGFTITIDSDLEGPSGYSQPVVLQEVGGSSNTVTVNTQSGNGINGGSSITLNQPYATTVLYWTGSEFRTDWFTQSVDAGTVTAGEVFTAPQGARLTKSSNQSAGDNTLVDPVSWESAEEFNTTTPAFADLANDQITIPNNDYTYAKATISIRLGSQAEFDLMDVQKNGTSAAGISSTRDVADATSMEITTGWIAVSSGDDFTARFRQVSGGAVDILSADSTFLEVFAV